MVDHVTVLPDIRRLAARCGLGLRFFWFESFHVAVRCFFFNPVMYQKCALFHSWIGAAVLWAGIHQNLLVP